MVETEAFETGMVPAGVNRFAEHWLHADGTPNEPIVLVHALKVARRK
jgi:hypothetical protein